MEDDDDAIPDVEDDDDAIRSIRALLKASDHERKWRTSPKVELEEKLLTLFLKNDC